MAVKEIVRTYVIDEDDGVHRFPRTRYAHLVNGAVSVPLFAGRTVRFAESVFGVEEGAIVYALAHFPLLHFDKDGRRDMVQQQAERTLASLESRCTEDSDWRQFYFAERMAALRWTPNSAVLQQLERYVPQLRGRNRRSPA
jgi:hypothetical protein